MQAFVHELAEQDVSPICDLSLSQPMQSGRKSELRPPSVLRSRQSMFLIVKLLLQAHLNMFDVCHLKCSCELSCSLVVAIVFRNGVEEGEE